MEEGGGGELEIGITNDSDGKGTKRKERKK
jgi:hypothetical protein